MQVRGELIANARHATVSLEGEKMTDKPTDDSRPPFDMDIPEVNDESKEIPGFIVTPAGFEQSAMKDPSRAGTRRVQHPESSSRTCCYVGTSGSRSTRTGSAAASSCLYRLACRPASSAARNSRISSAAAMIARLAASSSDSSRRRSLITVRRSSSAPVSCRI